MLTFISGTFYVKYGCNLPPYKDLKTGNFCVGGKEMSHIIYIIDSGIARCYNGKVTANTIKDTERFQGTPEFASRYAHAEIKQSSFCDLEPWVFAILDYYDTNTIFWKHTEDMKEIGKMKIQFFANPSEKNIFTILPKQYKPLIKEVGDLQSKSDYKINGGKINYVFLLNLLTNIGASLKYSLATKFDWEYKALVKNGH
uniref:Conjugal transfer protein n=1 Tax=Rhabditophanes sp. KR3021 TaxID=114890 RepID=A0AC35TV35_9BILA